MDIFDILTLLGGLCLFLFGMNLMGQALERSAGSRLEALLGKLTGNRFAGLLTGMGVTAVIQSSSATTVMVVGFVNSRLMSLKQAIYVIMGANIGTTITAWILSLGGISGDSIFLQLLKPMSFVPVLAMIGIGFYMFAKSARRKDVGVILLAFATLMFGMDIMTDAVSGLRDIPEFQQLFVMFTNPLLGVLAGAVLTAIIQSSSASVGILQALASTGAVSYGAAIPIIMGQNIGTCVTAMISSVGANKNAKRAAFVHLSFNIIGTAVWLAVFWLIDIFFSPALFSEAAGYAGIATAHSVFNVACTLLLLPASSLLEKLAYRFIPDAKQKESFEELDERLLATPAIALERAHALTCDMARYSANALKDSISCLKKYDETLAASIREAEEKTDKYEDMIGTYLVKLGGHHLNDVEGARASMLLKAIGDLERISDHASSLLHAAEELKEKKLGFSPLAEGELSAISEATREITELSVRAFIEDDGELALSVEPLEEIIDRLKELLRSRHIDRLREGSCSIEAGFVWNDIVTDMERVSDHCSNLAGCTIDARANNLNLHSSLESIRSESPLYREKYLAYSEKYLKSV